MKQKATKIYRGIFTGGKKDPLKVGGLYGRLPTRLRDAIAKRFRDKPK